ncbi:hypothetical protein SAMN04489712_12558 [Thermomonospora echinospora]|uniref:Uncharacterized protein n=1 Tax=Thermomonospora echinospora TaxID=1992 RepID=A0A1H6DXZ4_9ACTN|nr:hypothetical protein [Thermomonospora echinospora]SEG90168.1 hypothetical protein SAMN04489712_12558 [Thermomonospora echinospora]
MSADLEAQPEPVEVELIGESAEPVVSAPHRIAGGGWAVLSATGELLLMDGRLATVGRLPVPEGILPDVLVSAAGPRCRVDVSVDLRFVAFAATDRIVVVDRNGDVQWQTTHPVPSVDGDDVASCAVFTPDGTSLWAFVPWLTDAGAEPTGSQQFPASFSVERRVIDVADWSATARTATGYRCHGEVLVHPDGKHAGYGVFDGHDGWSFRWVRWDDGHERAVETGSMKPADIHPSGRRWLAHDDCLLLAGDLYGDTVSITPVEADEEDTEEDWEDHPYHGYDLDISAACLITADLVLARCDDLMEDENHPHLLFRVDPSHSYGPVSYPSTSNFRERSYRGGEVAIASAGDGTWLTFAPGVDRPHTGRLQRWRLSRPLCSQ